MADYAVIENGVLANVVVWDGASAYSPPDGATLEPMSALPSGASIGWTLSGGVWSAPSPAVDLSATITFLQFMALFASSEQDAIVASSDTETRLFVMMAAGSGGIQLSNPEVVAGVDYLASIGLITSTRAAAILAGSPPGG
jgi:hypothetical protein